MRLEGKNAIITGAASGIGRASAELFASEGARVLASDIDAEGLDETAARSTQPLTVVSGDCSREEHVRLLIEQCVEKHGPPSVFFANAGITGPAKPLFEQTAEDWEQILRVNLLGAFLAIKCVAPVMKEAGGGSIVCTASVAGLRSGAGPPAYSATKAGVISLVQTSANLLAGTGIRVNAICPGLIETGMTKPLFDYARMRGTEDRIGQLNPTGRAGQPMEIARVALFLASDDSSYVDGQAIAVDGGLSSSLPVTGPRRPRPKQ